MFGVCGRSGDDDKLHGTCPLKHPGIMSTKKQEEDDRERRASRGEKKGERISTSDNKRLLDIFLDVPVISKKISFDL